MKIDIVTAPPALEFGDGEGRFALRLKRFSGAERMAICDAVASGNLAAMQRAVGQVVVGWENVLDAAGNPIGFDCSEDGGLKNRFDGLMGALPLPMVGQVMAAIIAFVGLRADAEAVRSAFARSGAEIAKLDPTRQPAATTQPAA
jgi:hypothetical protein